METEEHPTHGMNPPGQGSALEAARILFESEELPYPYVPDGLAPALQPVGKAVFGTRDIESGLYTLEPFISELEQNPPKDYLLMGFDGHGTASWAMHYYLVYGPLAAFLQLSWANPFADIETSRRRVEGSLGLAESLIDCLNMAIETGKVPREQRLLVVESDFTPSRWGWIDTEGTTELQQVQRALFSAFMEIKKILRAGEQGSQV